MDENQEQPLFGVGVKTDNKKADDKKPVKKSSKKGILIGAIVGGVVLIGGVVLLIVLLVRPAKLTCTARNNYNDSVQKMIFEFGNDTISKMTTEYNEKKEFDNESEARDEFESMRRDMKESAEKGKSEYIRGIGYTSDFRITKDSGKEFVVEGTVKDEDTQSSMKAVLNGKSIMFTMTGTMTNGPTMEQTIISLRKDLKDKGITGGITKENVQESLKKERSNNFVCE